MAIKAGPPRWRRSLFLLLIALPLLAAMLPTEKYRLYVPKGFPAPPIPADNALTPARVELGRRLFFDPVLSVDSTISCGSCHSPALAFADSLRVSPGVEGRLGTRNAPSLANIVYHPSMLRDGGVPTIEMQALVPIQEHAEMDFNLVAVAERLARDPAYMRLCKEAYDRTPDAYTVTRALAAYERTLISGDSPWDRFFFRGQKKALNADQEWGWRLFRSPRTGCMDCHKDFNFTDYSFRNIGVHTAYADSGRARVTGMPEDRGLFMVPSLRNVALTAPYMHDGSMPDLRSVVELYNRGGEGHANQDSLITPLDLDDEQIDALVAFLEALTDSAFLARHAADAQPNL